MIFQDGKTSGGQATGMSDEQLVRLLQQSNIDLLAQLGPEIAERLKGIVGRMRVAQGVVAEMDEDLSMESLQSLARAMLKASSVEKTNIGGLGKEQEVKTDNAKNDRTLDLLADIP